MEIFRFEVIDQGSPYIDRLQAISRNIIQNAPIVSITVTNAQLLHISVSTPGSIDKEELTLFVRSDLCQTYQGSGS